MLRGRKMWTADGEVHALGVLYGGYAQMTWLLYTVERCAASVADVVPSSLTHRAVSLKIRT